MFLLLRPKNAYRFKPHTNSHSKPPIQSPNRSPNPTSLSAAVNTTTATAGNHPNENPPPKFCMSSTIHQISSILLSSPMTHRPIPPHSLGLLHRHPSPQDPPPNSKSSGFSSTGSVRHLYEQVVGSGVGVDRVTFTSIMHWLAEAGNVDGGDEGVGTVSCTALIKMFFGCGGSGRPRGV